MVFVLHCVSAWREVPLWVYCLAYIGCCKRRRGEFGLACKRAMQSSVWRGSCN